MTQKSNPPRPRRTRGDALSAIAAFTVLLGCLTALIYTIAESLH